MCEYTLAWACTAGCGTRRFNAVARTNTRAVGVCESLCFEVLGTLPEGFAPYRVRLCRFARHVSATVIDADGGKGLNLKSLKVS